MLLTPFLFVSVNLVKLLRCSFLGFCKLIGAEMGLYFGQNFFCHSVAVSSCD